MALSGEIQPQIAEGIDRKTLTTLRNRFIGINRSRLQRVLQATPARQYNVLQLIPLLFDVNHPLLPGYISRLTPHGLAAYIPDPNVLLGAQALTRSFSYRRHTAGRPLSAVAEIKVFYRLVPDRQAEISVLDELGALWRTRQPCSPAAMSRHCCCPCCVFCTAFVCAGSSIRVWRPACEKNPYRQQLEDALNAAMGSARN
jgi:hypothetical protein